MKTGIKGESSFTVTNEMLASKIGSGAVEVFSTPSMITAIERTAEASVIPFLESGAVTVGSHVDVAHNDATLEGMKVFVYTELTEISENGKFLTFKAEVKDDYGVIGCGTHVRAIINKARFIEKIKAKKGQ